MFTGGHSEILLDSLKMLGESKRSLFIEFGGYDEVSYNNMLVGLKYPDFPCGKYKFENGRMKMSKTLCGFFKLLDDTVFVPNMFSLSYSSHNGYFSIWHAMTYNPRGEVTYEIIDHIMAMCKLAILDDTLDSPAPNSFWLGFALHTIMDSYSPAHLVREGVKLPLPKKEAVSSKEKKEIIIVDRMKDKIRDISWENKNIREQDLDNLVDQVMNDNKIRGKATRRDVRELARFFLFHNQEMNSIAQIRSIVSKTLTHKIIEDPLEDPVFLQKNKVKRIRGYYYYPAQSVFFHQNNDLISQVKKYDLYDQCVLDCYSLLKLYKQALELMADKETRMDQLVVAYAFLRKVYKYLVNVTFKWGNQGSPIAPSLRIPKSKSI
jgi:hypothetical protein